MIHFEPLPQPRDPQLVTAYQVTLRVGGDNPKVIHRQSFDNLIDALISIQQHLPDGSPCNFDDLEYNNIFGAIHEHRYDESCGSLRPIHFRQ